MRIQAVMVLAGSVAIAAADPAAGLDVKLDDAIRRGVDFLVADQNKNGSWGSATRTKGLNIYAPLPGAHHAFRAGTSGLALSGLVDAADPRPEAEAAIERAAKWTAAELPKLRRADQTTTYNSWGHAYGMKAMVRLYQREEDPAKRAEWKRLAQQQVDLANRYEDVNGGWGYLDLDDLATQRPTGHPTPFTTATVLLSMHEAREVMGVTLEEKTVEHALNSIRALQSPDFTYGYSWTHRYRPRHEINRPVGSISRSQACNACLREFGDTAVTDEVVITWADRFLDREGFLHNTRKRPVPHEGPFKLAGYFYYYGIYYFTESVSLLPVEQQVGYAEKLAELLIGLQEKDGSWWDYPLYDYHQPYGTGYALMSLAWCREVLSRDI
ncbi:MAG: hypothetical protein ACQCXQ_15315 [Verrucomicrobiales bacterium]